MLTLWLKCHHDVAEEYVMIRTQVQLTDDQFRSLKRLAADRSVSVAELIRQGVQLFIRGAGVIDSKEQRARALSAAGRFHSRLSDISAQHDRYLQEAYEK